MSTKVQHPPELSVAADGLYTPEVGDWSEHKYRLLWHYADLFATSMKHKWDKRCFIDLFAGSGYARIRETGRVVQSSSLLALQVNNPFDIYIFCDADSNCMASLAERVKRLKPSVDCYFKNYDVNEYYADIISGIPPPSKTSKVLSFCFVDPCGLSDIRFDTIKNLSARFMDFLIHIPAMDPIRNEGIYSSASSTVVSDYLGISTWRELRKRGNPIIPFDVFIAIALDNQMKSLGYKYGGISENVMIRSTGKNLPLYNLAFYSKADLGAKFWKVTKRLSDPQLPLFT